MGGRDIRLEGVKVDCIDVGSTPAADLDPGALPEDQFDRAFVLAHRWALDSATPASLTVVSGERVPLATVSCRVATPAALVAMKLQSAPRRRAERAHKGPNDYGDLYALFTRPESLAGIAADLPGAPHGLGQWCAQTHRTRIRDGCRPDGPGHPTDHARRPSDSRRTSSRSVVQC